jgi:lysophospholipase L1-like esterase
MLSKSRLGRLGFGACVAAGCLGNPREHAASASSRSGAPGTALVASSSSIPSPGAVPASAAPAAAGPAPSSAPSPSAPPSPPVPPSSGAAARHRLVVLGDSLSDSKVNGGGYLQPLARCPNLEIENLARGGFMVNQMRRRFESQVLPRLPGAFDQILIFGGVNDLYSDETAGRTVEKISADLEKMYRASKAAGLRVIALTVAPWGGFHKYFNARRTASTLQLNAWIRAQRASGLVDVVLDTYPLLSCGNSEELCPDFVLPFKDGLHFGKGGHQKLGAALLNAAFPECAAK